MSEQTEQVSAGPFTEAKTEDQPAEVDWKAKAREWEKRAKDNKSAADELAQLREQQKTAEQKAAEREAAAEKRAAEAEARALRREIALEHKLTREDAELLDGLNDEDAMRRLAKRLAVEDKRVGHVPTQGTGKPDGKPLMSGKDRAKQYLETNKL